MLSKTCRIISFRKTVSMKNIIMADGPVGAEICNWLISHYREDIGLIVVTCDNDVSKSADIAGIPHIVFSTNKALEEYASNSNMCIDWGFLIWWPFIISKSLISLPLNGYVNTHPSLLPYNRGKHYNFWALVEQAPFGVTLHMVEEHIDSGDIIAQTPIWYDWEDTGASLYEKASTAIIELFKTSYPLIREDRIQRTPQDLTKGSFHLAKELEPASRIDLDATYTARDFLNLLRARTFTGHPACTFYEKNGEEFEVRVEIRKVIK
jgi:methionyl-tRNA formyltransferase